jgi:hypothetical protein
MAHLPVNHPSRPFVRLAAAGIGIYILGFGIVGLVESSGLSVFDRGDTWALGLQTNPAFSILSILAGAVILGAALVGRNVDHFVSLWGGILFLVAGLGMMAVLHTEANLLNFALPNVVVSLLIGMALVTVGLYSKSGPPEVEVAEELFRHSEIGQIEFDESVESESVEGESVEGESVEGRSVESESVEQESVESR